MSNTVRRKCGHLYAKSGGQRVRARASGPTPTTAANYLTELSGPVSPNNRGPYLRRVVTGADSFTVFCIRSDSSYLSRVQVGTDILNERTDECLCCG